MNKNIILTALLTCSIVINLIVLWPTNYFLVSQTKNFIQSIVYSGSIKKMFEENMNLINKVLTICEKNSSKNITDQELAAAANEIKDITFQYAMLFDRKQNIKAKYAHLAEQRLALNNPFGPDWAGTSITQWMQLIYILNKKTTENPQAKIYAVAQEIILNTINFETKALHEHVAAMKFLDAQKK